MRHLLNVSLELIKMYMQLMLPFSKLVREVHKGYNHYIFDILVFFSLSEESIRPVVMPNYYASIRKNVRADIPALNVCPNIIRLVAQRRVHLHFVACCIPESLETST